MNRDLLRIAFLLASSGITDAEIERALYVIKLEGVGPFLEMLADARRTIRLASQKLDAPEPSQGSRVLRSRAESGYDAVAADIARTLQDDLGLTAQLAASALLNSLLADRHVATDRIPQFRTKDGFKVWCRKLVRAIPSNVLLHHVSRIKNEMGDRKRGDWPLRDRNG